MLIGICENRGIFLTALKKAVRNWAKNGEAGKVQIVCYSSEFGFMDDWERSADYDMLFLDTEFPKKGGFQLLSEIRKKDRYLPVVLLSEKNGDPQACCRFSVFRFLKFPLRQADVSECLNEVYRIRIYRANDYYTVRDGEIRLRLPVRDILCFASYGHYTEIETVGGEKYVVVRNGSMDCFAAGLPGDLFLRCHQCYIVNRLYVSRYGREKIELFDGRMFPVGGNYRAEVRRRLDEMSAVERKRNEES